MSLAALYDVFTPYKDIHQTVLKLADSLDDNQLRWKPEGYATSIGFHLWHVARESDYLKAALRKYFPEIAPELGEPVELWLSENLAAKWGFPDLGEHGVGTGLSDEVAATLPIPPKSELIDYLRRAYEMVEEYVLLLDERYAQLDGQDLELQKKVERIRFNLVVFMLHDARHLGMMECLKGLQTGFGSATETRGK